VLLTAFRLNLDGIFWVYPVLVFKLLTGGYAVAVWANIILWFRRYVIWPAVGGMALMAAHRRLPWLPQGFSAIFFHRTSIARSRPFVTTGNDRPSYRGPQPARSAMGAREGLQSTSTLGHSRHAGGSRYRFLQKDQRYLWPHQGRRRAGEIARLNGQTTAHHG